MTYSSFMVHLDLGVPNDAILRIAADLADRYNANIVGVAAYQPLLDVYGSGYVPPELYEEDRKRIDRDIEAAEGQFRSALKHNAPMLQWRSAVGYQSLATYLADQACMADVFLIAAKPPETVFGQARSVGLGDLVMQIGRPLLVVPVSEQALELDHVVVGWNNTTESRRAVWDALPLLRNAGQVTLVQVAAPGDLDAIRAILQDVVVWLESHGVAADYEAVSSNESDSHGLEAFAVAKRAGLMVAGAYGHNRVREWVLGGVTRNLLTCPSRCTMLSH